MDQKILWKLSYGVYAVCTLDGNRPVGCIANSAMQVTAEPASIALSLNHDNYTYECVKKTGRFSLCVLPESCSALTIGKLGFFSSRDTDKFDGLDYEFADGLPVLKDSCGYIILEVEQELNAGTHSVLLAKVADCAVQSEASPMTYAYYHNVIKGKSPKNAPTYRGEEKAQPAAQYRCSICGYLYDGQTPFEQLSEDYVCPICKAPKKMFVPVK